MNDDKVVAVPKYCSVCNHKLIGTEFMCPKCGHCVVCK